MFHCGVSVDMNYDYDGSGASVETANYALKHYFKYRSGSHFEDINDYDDSTWKFMLRQDLDMHHPILYRGTNDNGDGHAFVCDGYQDTSYFHFNWGWGGANDGYFHLGKINPNIDFYWGQGAIININPYSADYCNSLVFDQPQWTVDDGSGPNKYWNNSSCEWLIEPEGANFIHVEFTQMSIEPNSDYLYFYNGVDESAPLIATYSGYDIPESFDVMGSALFVKFVTDAQGQDHGWEFNYEINVTDIDNVKTNQFEIYPNPVSNMLYVNSNLSFYCINIYDIYGKLLISKQIDEKSISIDVASLASGIYFIKLIGKDQKEVRKIIVQ
jgi:hypothetical protein